MPHIVIEPNNRYSIRNVQRIIKLLRSHKNIHDHTIFDIEVNGYDEWTIEISYDDYYCVLEDVELLIKMNQELFKEYIVRNEKWIR